MPRPLRLQAPDVVYHVTIQGVDGAFVFRDDADRRRLLVILGSVLPDLGWRCYAYCLMSTHFHLLVETPNADLARGMQLVNGIYAQTFNRRHARRGHLFGGRYGAELVETDEHALEALRYIALNPVRAGICRNAEDWPWSSYRAALGLAPQAPFVEEAWTLSWFVGATPARRAAFRAFVESAPDLALRSRGRSTLQAWRERSGSSSRSRDSTDTTAARRSSRALSATPAWR
jgi:REP element-mobilizing transposase RayT